MFDAANETLITTAEAAERLKVTPMTIRRWIDDGTLEGISHGRFKRTSLEALSRFGSASRPAAERPRRKASHSQVMRALKERHGI